MNRRGVCYDTGRVMWGRDWRPAFSAAETHRELGIIHRDLGCNAVRLCGEDLDRLTVAGADALDQGLEVWLSPELWDHTPAETLDYIARAAERAEDLRRHRPGRVVLCVASELTLFMAGIVPGRTVFERLEHPAFGETVRAGDHNRPLNAFLSEAAACVRERFHGAITYASVPLERVDWQPFDIVGVDLYRDARIRERFAHLLDRYLAFERPVAITEFGCCTYRGAAAAGGRGFAILDTSGGTDSTPTRLDGDYLRDEAEQARELTELLDIFDRAGVDATFLMTFVTPLNPYSDDPRHDLDMASYSLVKSFADHRGTTYPDLPWEPKQSFRAVAEFYRRAVTR